MRLHLESLVDQSQWFINKIVTQGDRVVSRNSSKRFVVLPLPANFGAGGRDPER